MLHTFAVQAGLTDCLGTLWASQDPSLLASDVQAHHDMLVSGSRVSRRVCSFSLWIKAQAIPAR